MKKLIIFLFLLVVGTLLAGVYGALYDQVTYSISPEFFIKMRFTSLNVAEPTNIRWEVAKIGFQNAWRVGFLLGLVLSLTSFIHPSLKNRIKFTLQGFGISLFLGLIFAFLAYLFVESSVLTDPLTPSILDKQAYRKVELMNNYSHVGAIIGMFLGIGWQILKTRKQLEK